LPWIIGGNPHLDSAPAIGDKRTLVPGVMMCLNMLDAEQSGLFITLIRGLWVLRNRWVFERKRENTFGAFC